jgi:endonuclease YncB( thermonuclease family)
MYCFVSKKNYKSGFLIIGIIVVIIIIGLIFAINYRIKPHENSLKQPLDCFSSENSKTLVNIEKGKCSIDSIQRVIDGDTIKTKSGESIRLSLVAAPELDKSGGIESKEFVQKLCTINSQIFIDEDDGQLEGSYGRTIAKVYCGNTEKSVNELVIENNHGIIYKKFCKKSEFGAESWAKKYGC